MITTPDINRFQDNYLNNIPMYFIAPGVAENNFKTFHDKTNIHDGDANELSAYNAERGNYLNMVQTQWQAAWDLYLRDINNEYNSPSQQMQRYMEAGVNPLWAISGAEPGNAQQLTAPKGFPANVAGVSYEDQALANDMAKFSMDNGLRSILGFGDLDIKNRNLSLQEKLGKSQIDKTKAEVNLLKSQLETNEFVNNVNSRTFDTQVNLKINELNLSRQTIKKLEAETDLTKEQEELLKVTKEKESALKLQIEAATKKIESETFDKLENLRQIWYGLNTGRMNAQAAQSSAAAAQTSAEASMMNARTNDAALHHQIEKDTKELRQKNNQQILEMVDMQRGWLDRFLGTTSNVISGALGNDDFELVQRCYSIIESANSVLSDRCYSDPTEANLKAYSDLLKRIEQFRRMPLPSPQNFYSFPQGTTVPNPSSSWQQSNP